MPPLPQSLLDRLNTSNLILKRHRQYLAALPGSQLPPATRSAPLSRDPSESISRKIRDVILNRVDMHSKRFRQLCARPPSAFISGHKRSFNVVKLDLREEVPFLTSLLDVRLGRDCPRTRAPSAGRQSRPRRRFSSIILPHRRSKPDGLVLVVFHELRKFPHDFADDVHLPGLRNGKCGNHALGFIRRNRDLYRFLVVGE